MQYHLPPDTWTDWALNETRGFEPNERQILVIETVRRAIDVAKLFYTKDVYGFCVELLKPDSETLAKNAKKVEGGEVGMDLYYARRYLDARKVFALEDASAAKLMPMVGMKLGKLRMQNLKCCTGSIITTVAVDSITVEATVGSRRIRLFTNARDIAHMMNQAHERRQRDTNFEQFCSGLLAPAGKNLREHVESPCLSLF